jgi:hypothetical protein
LSEPYETWGDGGRELFHAGHRKGGVAIELEGTRFLEVVKDAVNDANGDEPLATAYRSLIHSRRLTRLWSRVAQEEHRKRQVDLVAVLTRVMWNNREGANEDLANLLFTARFLGHLGLFSRVSIATPGPWLRQRMRAGEDLLDGQEGFLVPKALVRRWSFSPFQLSAQGDLMLAYDSPLKLEHDRALILRGLATLLTEAGFAPSDQVEELLAFSAVLLSKTVITPYFGQRLENPPPVRHRQARQLHAAAVRAWRPLD